jgi:hypothetical protein
LCVQQVSIKLIVLYREISNMRFIRASAILLPIVGSFTGFGTISLAESSSPVAQISAGDKAAEADAMPDLELAANGKKKGPKGAVDHGKIVQPAQACGNVKRRGPKERENEDTGKVAGGDSVDVDAKVACPPPKDLPSAVKGKGPKLRDKVPTN